MRPPQPLFLLALVLPPLTCLSLNAQAVRAGSEGPTIASSVSVGSTSGPAEIVPLVRGFNLAVGSSLQHDSSNGWSSLLSPDIAYRFTRHVSADVGVPVYTGISILVTGGSKPKPTEVQTLKHFVLGDTNLSAHFEANPALLSYNLTTTLGLPTGNSAFGLGAGQVTYYVNNHLEKSFGPLSPDIEIGIADSSSLVTRRVRKSYLSVGTLAHFQAGSSIDLPYHLSFSADAYEELPLSAQTLYSTTGRGKKKKRVATGKSIAEDNGFATSLDIPLTPHLTGSGSYNRSLRAQDDTFGLSLTFLLKPPPRPEN